MKSLMTTLIIAMALIGGMTQKAQALGASGQPIVEYTFPIFGTEEYEARCAFEGFDPNIEACAIAKQACQYSLRECVIDNCNHKNNPRRYECTYEQWHGDNNSFTGGCGDVIQNPTNASLKDLCRDAVAAQQGGGTGGSSDNGTPPQGYIDVTQPSSDEDDTSTDSTPPATTGGAVDPHPLEVLAEVINNSPDPDAARAYFQYLHQLILLEEAIDALPTEGQRQAARDYLVALNNSGSTPPPNTSGAVDPHPLVVLQDAIENSSDPQAAREYFEFLHQLSLLQEAINALPVDQRQAARDYLMALNAENKDGLVEVSRPVEDNQVTFDSEPAHQASGSGCQLASSGGSSQAWYLIIGLFPLMVMNLRRK